MTLRMGPSSRAAHDALRNQGLPLPKRPDVEMPTLPDDLTSEDDKSLMGLYSLLTAWSDYVGVQLACASSDEKKAASSLDVLQAKTLSAATASGAKVTQARASMKSDQEITAARNALYEMEAYRRLVESLYNALERDTQLISRELTRRTAHQPRERFLT